MFEIEVISNPAAIFGNGGIVANGDISSMTRYDETLIKPALLLADRVHLITGREDMSQIVNSEAFELTRMPMRILSRFALVSRERNPVDLEILGIKETNLASGEDLDSMWVGPNYERLEEFAEKYSAQIEMLREGNMNLLRRRHDDLASPALQKAQESGILTVSPWLSKGANTFDQIWKMVWDSKKEEFFDEGVEALENHLASSESSILMEQGASSILSSDFIRSNMGRRDAKLDQSIQISSLLTQQIPSLSKLPLEEVLNLREQLKDYLIPFRAGILKMADEISEAEDLPSKSLAQVSELKWQKEVAPAYQELKMQIQEGAYSRQLLDAFATDKGSVVAVGSAITLAVGGVFAGVGSVIGAAAAASYPFIKALNQKVKSRHETKGNRLYFLYEMEKRAPK